MLQVAELLQLVEHVPALRHDDPGQEALLLLSQRLPLCVASTRLGGWGGILYEYCMWTASFECIYVNRQVDMR